MANRLEEMITQARSDGMNDLADKLERQMKVLGDDPSEEEIESAIHEVLMAELSGLLPGGGDGADSEYMEKAIACVKEAFDEQEWRYSFNSRRPDLAQFDLGFGINGVSLKVRVFIEDMPKVCRIDAVLPISAEEVYAYPLCKELAKANYPKRFGAFQYDQDDGELSYRYSYPIANGFHKDDFLWVFRAIIHSAVDDDVYPVIKKFATGRFKNKDKNEILTQINNLVEDISD